jgi:hypothetical protein
MKSGIFLIQSNDHLIEMKEQAYDSEGLLQELLAKYPNLLAGNQMSQSEPRRWLLISREASIPMQEETVGRLSVDHLFIDQDGIPTFIEVKRSSDTRIRREVVGQMLDYVANAVVYLTVEAIQANFRLTWEALEIDPEDELQDFLGIDADPEEFWQTVKTNLRAGKIRMLFVADEIPPELRRIVEFLNEQMNQAEVLAVEIRQYAGEGLRTLVPRVMGLTAEAERSKGVSEPARQWDEETFFVDLKARKGSADAEVAQEILDWAKINMPDIFWGKGKVNGSFIPGLNQKGTWHQVIRVSTNGYVEFSFQYMQPNPPFDDPAKRLELLHRLNKIQGIDLSEDTIDRRPSVPISLFHGEKRLEELLRILDWTIQEIRNF